MSRPPATIQIKRKATDDPVDILLVHEANSQRKRRATEFVFTRQSTDSSLQANNGLSATGTASQGGRSIKPLPRMNDGSLSTGPSSLAGPAPTVSSLTSSPSQAEEPNAPTITSNSTPTINIDMSQFPTLLHESGLTRQQFAQRRKFHMSKNSTTRGRQSRATGGNGKVQKRGPTVFMEKRSHSKVSKKKSPRATPKIRTPTSTTPEEPRSGNSTTPEESDGSQKQKRPGLGSRTASKKASRTPSAQSGPPTPALAQSVSLPSGLTMPWDVTSDRLAKELEAYTLLEIGRSIAASQSTDPVFDPEPSIQPRIKKPASSKFQPKKPAMRYHERHPEVAALAPPHAESDHEETDSDCDYVIDTYIRMPAEQVGEDPEADFGYIILESEDIEEFYQDEEELSENEDYDEEDENAENHYSADYPDDEVESDDEYNRNAYHYRIGIASDDEEFDEDDYDMADDHDDDTARYPWRKPNKLPAWMRKGAGMEVSDDEEDLDGPAFATAADPNKKDPLADLFGGLTTDTPMH